LSGISPEPSSATIAAPHPDTLRCNTVGALGEGERVDRILSANTGGFAAVEAFASAHKKALA
jgi:hypothetical protein